MEANINNNQTQQNESIDIKKFIFKIIANWYWFAFSVFVTISVAYFINRYSDPIFSQRALVLVADKDNSISGGIEGILEQQGILRTGRKKVVENEIAVLNSYRMTYKTICKLPEFAISYFGMGRIRTVEFYKSCPFEVILDTNRTNNKNHQVNIKLISENEYLLEIDANTAIKKKLKYGEWYSDSSFTFCLNLIKPYVKSDPTFSYQYFFVINDIHQLTNEYKGKLSLSTTDKKSTIIELSTQGLVPQKEADFLNKLLEVYINSGLEEKNQIALNTIAFIDNQLNDITDSLEINENRLQNFRENNKLIDISKEGSILYEKVDRVQSEKAMLTIKSKYFDYLKKYLDDKKDFTDLMAPSIVGIDDPMLIKLITDLGELSKQKNNYEYASNIKNPATEMVNNQIESNRKALLENIRNLIQSNIISINEIDKRIAEVEAEIAKLPSTEKQLITIQRKYKLNDQIYTYLLTKRAESGIAKASNVPDNKIIDNCLVQNAAQVGPKKTLNYTIAILIGILIPLIIIIIADFFNDKILDRHDVESRTDIPIMAAIGHNNKSTDFVVYEKPKSSIAESFRTLRTNLQYLHIDKKLTTHTIALTSTVSGEGKSFCAVNLASIFALSGKKTIIMGLDLRKPKLHKDFKLDNSIGISTYLIGNNTLDEIIVHSFQENLHVVTSGPIPPNPAELLESEKMNQLIMELKARYEIIIIDTPPVALVTDSLLLSKYVDTNIYVVRQDYSSRTVLKFVNSLYKDNNYQSMGILINDVKIPSYYGNRYGYGYKYGAYGYGYGSGYGYGYYDDDEIHDNRNAVKKTISNIPLPKFWGSNKKK
jgi:capsular exopolysaccharide synthesis family protein